MTSEPAQTIVRTLGVGESLAPPTLSTNDRRPRIWPHLLTVGAGLLTLTVFQGYDLFWLNHAFSASGYGMAIGAMAGGSALGAGALAWGASNFLGSGGGNITEG